MVFFNPHKGWQQTDIMVWLRLKDVINFKRFSMLTKMVSIDPSCNTDQGV